MERLNISAGEIIELNRLAHREGFAVGVAAAVTAYTFVKLVAPRMKRRLHVNIRFGKDES